LARAAGFYVRTAAFFTAAQRRRASRQAVPVRRFRVFDGGLTPRRSALICFITGSRHFAPPVSRMYRNAPAHHQQRAQYFAMGHALKQVEGAEYKPSANHKLVVPA
jgi:hypothetical protein